LGSDHQHRKCIVVAYPLCDGAIYLRHLMSYGIHTIWVRFLDTNDGIGR
jgi:hypothetical protein